MIPMTISRSARLFAWRLPVSFPSLHFSSGVRRTNENGAVAWGGYTFAGDFAVYASDVNPHLVQGVLDSARVTNG
jgi:hypothetical protein